MGRAVKAATRAGTWRQAPPSPPRHPPPPRTTTHGIRSAFKTWATERTNYPREVVELCLSHAQGDPLERAYQRGDIIEKRRRLMQEWADYCQHGDQQQAGNVVPMRA